MTEKSSYRQVLKATSIFGGAQIFIILIGLARSKVIATTLGTSGFGIASLFNAPLQLIAAITSLGISFSAVRSIAIAKEQNDSATIGRTYAVLNKWLWITGLLGVGVTVLLAPFLSIWSFGNYSYTITFLCLSLTLLLLSFSNGQLAFLRGVRYISASAKSSVIGPLLGLVVSLPLYFYWGVKAIAPAIFLTSLITLFSVWLYFRKVKPKKLELPFKQAFYDGKNMIRLGIVMTLSGLLSQLVGYLIVLFISNMGGVDQVGLYNAGYSMTNQYVGVVFSAILVDYFPRLSAISTDNNKIREAVNQQGEITILLLSPIILFFIIVLPILVKLLFSSDFVQIITFVRLMAIGMIFRATSWVASFVPGAKGDNKFFLLMEVIGCTIYFIVSFVCYKHYGLEGLGVAFIIHYICYWGIIYVSMKVRYGYSINKKFLKIICIQLSLLAFALYVVEYATNLYWMSIAILLLSMGYSLLELNKRVRFINALKRNR